MNILLTGAGGVYIKHLIRKLDKNIFDEVTIVDCNYKTLKNIRANFKYKVPKGDNKKFLPAISKIIKTRNIKVVVCVVDKELIKFHKLNNKILLLQPKRNFQNFVLISLSYVESYLKQILTTLILIFYQIIKIHFIFQ